jgi:hypothetical protein
MLTFSQVQNSSVANVAGVNVADPQFLTYVNDAVRMLVELGNGDARGWWGTVQLIRGTAYDGCMVWPANVSAVLAVRHGHREAPVKNFWHSFTGESWKAEHWGCRWGHHESVMEFDGQTCLFYPIEKSPTQIAAMAQSPADSNVASITLYGLDANGNEVFDPTLGTRGITLTPGSSGNYFTATALSQVTDIGKAATNGPIQLYAYSPTTGIGNLLATYQGGDVNPKFMYSRIRNRGNCPVSISALLKLGFKEVYQPNDIVPLDNVDAIKSMVQSIRARESNNDGLAQAQERDALRRLVAQVNTHFPKEQFVCSFSPFGHEPPVNHLSML